MNTLIAIGTSSAFIYSIVATFFPSVFEIKGYSADVYFDTSATIIVLILLGRLFEARSYYTVWFILIRPQRIHVLLKDRRIMEKKKKHAAGRTLFILGHITNRVGVLRRRRRMDSLGSYNHNDSTFAQNSEKITKSLS